MLTALEIKNAKPGKHPDGNGLYLQVKKGGTKSWFYRFQINKRRREMGLGTLDELKAPEARALVPALALKVRAGIDPIEERNAQAAATALQRANSARNTFREVAKSYLESHQEAWRNTKHRQQWANTLKTYVDPVIGDIDVAKVTTEQILQILTPIWHTKTETASRVRGRLESIFAYAIVSKMRTDANPAIWRGHLQVLLPSPKRISPVEHQPSLPHLEAPAFMEELRKRNGFGARALEFLILTATRSEETRGAKWDEINLERGIWQLPRSRQKIKDGDLDDHFVPLSRQAIALLKNLPRFEATNLVFPGTGLRKGITDTTLSNPITAMNHALTKAGEPARWIDPTLGGREAVPHGFRSTFRDWAAETTDFPKDVIEYALAHSLPNKVEAAYQRSKLIDRRIPLMQAWADYLDNAIQKAPDATLPLPNP